MVGWGGGVVGGPCDYCVSPVQRIGFWGFSDFVRTFGSGLGTVGTGDSDLDLGLTILTFVLTKQVFLLVFLHYL